jgi:hypothetical protein
VSQVARQKLIELVSRFGSGVCDDPRRCEALLRDVCGQEKREFFVLVSAARERVGAELLNSTAGIPAEALLARLTKRLHENLGLAEDLARWGVETWALALGVSSTKEEARTSPEESRSLETAATHDDDNRIGEGPSIPAEKVVRDAARRALSTGFITEAQRRRLNKLCKDLGMPGTVARRIVADVKKELDFDPDLPFDCPRCGASGRMPYYFGGRTVQCPDCHESWDTQFAPIAPDGAGSRAGTAPVITAPVVPQPSMFLSKAVQVQLAVVAWAMMISGAWGCLFSGAFFIASLVRFFDSNLGPGVGSLLLLLLNIAICRAGFHLKERRQFRSVLVGLVAGSIPINVFCFFLTTPLAIWGIVLFCRRDVRREFDADRLVWKKGSEEGGSSAAPLPGVTDDDFIEMSLSE